MTTISILIIVVGFRLGDRQGLLIGFAIALFLNGLVYYSTDARIRNLLGGQELFGQDAWQLEETVTRLAQKARIPKPSIIIVGFQFPTTLSTGRSWQRGTIYVSEGLLKALTDDEIKAVLAYEISRIKRLDTLAMGIGSSLSAALLAIPRWIDLYILNPLFGTLIIFHPFQRLIASIAALPLKLVLARSNYYAADQMAARLMGQPQSLASALWKMHSFAGAQNIEISPSHSHLFVVNPMMQKQFQKHFNLHPPIEKRIEKLVGYFPI